jgi:DUF1680 family protein
MKTANWIVLVMLSASPARASGDYPIQPVPFTDVHLSDSFWAKRIEVNRRITIPFVFRQNLETGRVDNFAKAAGRKRSGHEGQRYNDTDVFKAIEGASYSLSAHPDRELEKELDGLIELVAAAQEEDGYLFTARTIDPGNPIPGIGESRWSNLPVSHELYNAGHLYEAAVAHFQATGKRTLLDVAIKNADLLVSTFGPGKKKGFPGHQEVEIGLAKLYRVTGKESYLQLAKYFLEARGRDVELEKYPPGSRFAIYNDPIQIQAHRPILEQDEAVGHAVRAAYMFTGMADVAALAQESRFVEAIGRLWDNVVSKKLYLTGGIGARHDREAFGGNYELPNKTAYNETCAAIGNVFWNHRMFLLHGDAKYIDVLERILYNGVISGISLRGDSFFYPNPLESDGKFLFNKGVATRKAWFDVACCPGNIARFIPSVPGYVYARRQDDIYVNLFIQGTGKIDSSLRIRQETDYPWDGRVTITLEPDEPRELVLNLRIPGWARGEPVPSDLYRYEDEPGEKPMLKVNGEPVKIELAKGFARIRRKWETGDIVELELPMPIRRVRSHEKVEENQGKIALERGPLVYCAEGIDNGGQVSHLSLKDGDTLAYRFQKDLLGGIGVITGNNKRFAAIPYYAWSHRGVGEMAVWLPKR